MICPVCSQFNDPALTPSGRLPPQDWQPIICVGCTAVLVLDHAWPGGLRPPDDTDWAAWQDDRRLAVALLRALNAVDQTRKEDPDDRPRRPRPR